MKVKGLDGRNYQLALGAAERNRERDCSEPHKRARSVLARLFPADRIHEEVFVPGCPFTLYLDFFLPLRRVAVEVHGDQHYSFNHYFHGDQVGFLQSLKRDRIKREWCELNQIVLVELPHYETDEEWSTRINQRGDS